MAANDLVLCEEPQQENKEDMLELDDSDIETLSFCDLPLNNKASDWEEYYLSFKEDQSTSFHHQDFFQFFSEELTSDTGTHYNPKDNNMFFGKLITHKESEAPIKAHDSMTNDIKAEPTKKSPLPTSRYLNKPKTGSLTTKQKCFEGVAYKGERVNDFPTKKMSVLASPMRSRWYLFAFGVGRFPMEMELTDMKTRQRKKRQTKGYPSNGSSQMVKSGSSSSSSSSSENNSSSVRGNSRKIWSMVDFLGCRSQHADVVAASIGSMVELRGTGDHVTPILDNFSNIDI